MKSVQGTLAVERPGQICTFTIDLTIYRLHGFQRRAEKTGLLFPWCLSVCCLEVGERRVHLRVQARNSKGRTNTLVIGTGKQEQIQQIPRR